MEVTTIGIDPGGTTGWAVIHCSGKDMIRQSDFLPGMAYDCGQFTGAHDEQVDLIMNLVYEFPHCAVVVEDFHIRQMNVELSPVQIESRIAGAIYRERPPCTYFLQGPSLAKSTATDLRLKQWGLWEPGKQHARDAMRHCVTFNRRAQSDPSLLAAAWPLLLSGE